jgi:hypothetical protein
MTNCLLRGVCVSSECFRSSQNGAGGLPSDIDGKPKGCANWRERIKRPRISVWNKQSQDSSG